MARLRVVLLHGVSGSGKTYATERVLALDYHVTTDRMDSLYANALETVGVPRPRGGYGVCKWARMLHGGEVEARLTERFFARLSVLVVARLREAQAWRVALVLEGYTLKFPGEVALVREAAEAVAGEGFDLARIQVVPSAEDWRRNRVAKFSRRRGEGRAVAVLDKPYRGREALEAVEGVDDYVAAGVDEVRALADGPLALRRYQWHQRFTLGPVSARGRVGAAEKLRVVQDRDVVGRSLVDVCCNTGVHALLAKQRGAGKVVGIELNPRNYCKALELRKVVRRHSDLDARVRLLHGDMVEVLPGLGSFDTLLFFGALHYFADYEAVLAAIARATEVAYVEFAFSEGENDTAAAPGAIRPWVRKTGKTIYMGDREAVAGTVRRAMPGFEIEARTPITRRASDREIWRLRRP